MKLTKDQKGTLKFLKALAMQEHQEDVNVIHSADAVTIAWVRNFANSKMITVATSYFDTDEDDRFRKSTGAFFALSRLIMGEATQLPLGEYEDDEIDEILSDLFLL